VTDSNLVYKFLSPDRRSFFSEPAVRFSPLNALNDPFEGRAAVSGWCDLDTFKKYSDDILVEFVKVFGWTGDNLKAAQEAARDNPEKVLAVIDEGKGKFPDAIREQHEKYGIGILSLSKNPGHELMWAHYAKNHTGFAVGMEPSAPFFKTSSWPDLQIFDFNEVKYHKIRPTIFFHDTKNNEILFFNCLFQKSIPWEYESEWRAIIADVNKIEKNNIIGLVDLPIDIIGEVRLGFNVTSEIEKDALHFCHTHSIPLKKARLHKQKWVLEFDTVAF